MKNKSKRSIALFAFVLLSLAVLSGCAAKSETPDTSKAPAAAVSEQTALPPKTEQDKEPEPQGTGDKETESRTLIVSFSCTGNTKPLAQMTAEILNADFYEIIPQIPYTPADIHYQDEGCRANKEQKDETARPEIAGEKLDLSGYNTVLISFPIWWGKEPRIIDTFMEAYDFSGKTLAAFCTSGGSGVETAESNLKALAPNAVWAGAKRFEAGASRENLSEWLKDIGVEEKN